MLPNDPDDMNDLRANAAALALQCFALEIGEIDLLNGLGSEAANNLEDLFTNLAHFCDRRGLSLAAAIRGAKAMYGEETEGQGRQFTLIYTSARN